MIKEKNMNDKEKRRALNGTGDALHILSIADTVLCAFLISFLANSLLCDASGPLALAGCALLICALLAANAVIYRKIKRKIFEHYSIAFIGAGALTLLFMLASLRKVLYLICGGALILTGSVFLLIYGIIYKRNMSHEMPLL